MCEHALLGFRVLATAFATAFGLGVTCGVSAAAGEDTQACLSRPSVEPKRAYVGQQVLYRVRILRRESVTDVSWHESLSFPSLRSEWLPGRSPDPAIRDIGEHAVVYEERRALFPLRAGRLRIPGATLRCALEENAERRDVLAPVEPVTLEVLELPESGRPEDFSGVVGPIELRLSVGQHRVRLGESVPLSFTARGEANVWDVRLDLARTLSEAGVQEIDLFAGRARVTLEPGDRLSARFARRYELVPRRAGRLRLPSLRVPYFDPETESYHVARTAPLEIEVQPRAQPGAETSAPGASTSRRSEDAGTKEPGRPGWRALGAAGLVLAVLLAAGFAVRTRRRSLPPAARDALAEARRLERTGEPARAQAALARALRLGLEARVPGARSLTPDEIQDRCPDDPACAKAVRALARLERARFEGAMAGGEDETSAAAASEPRLGSREVRDLLRRLRRRPKPPVRQR